MTEALFVLGYAAACVAFVPAAPLTLGAGAAFGVAKGFALVWPAATLGACAAFLLGRTLLRGWIERRLERFPAFGALSRGVAREGWKVVLLARLSPVIPFNALNYALGLTRVSFRDYAWASAVGMAPGCLLFTWLGAAAGDAARAGAGARTRTPAEWALFAAGLAATAALTVLVSRAARRALDEAAP